MDEFDIELHTTNRGVLHGDILMDALFEQIKSHAEHTAEESQVEAFDAGFCPQCMMMVGGFYAKQLAAAAADDTSINAIILTAFTQGMLIGNRLSPSKVQWGPGEEDDN